MSDWSAKNPYSSNLTENFVLNGEGSRKETRHIVFDLGDSGLQYKAGDALGVIPRCPPELAEDVLASCGFSGDEEVDTHLGPCGLRQALTERYEIHRISKKWIEELGPRLSSGAADIEIRIVHRQRTSSRDGSVLIDWNGSGAEDDVPVGYVEIGSASDPAETLWAELTGDSKAMEDYIWSRDYICLLYTSDAADE